MGLQVTRNDARTTKEIDYSQLALAKPPFDAFHRNADATNESALVANLSDTPSGQVVGILGDWSLCPKRHLSAILDKVVIFSHLILHSYLFCA